MRSPRLPLLLLALACGPLQAAETTAPAGGDGSAPLAQAVANPQRKAEDRARDGQRHPLETLQFFELQPYHTVVELWPGRGWYTDILGPLLKDHGQLIAAHFPADSPSEFFRNTRAEFLEHLRANRGWLGEIEVVELGIPGHFRLAADDSVDRALTFRNTHNWINAGIEAEVYAAVYRALRPGGIFGVVQHRARSGTDARVTAKSGYVPERAVIRMAEAAGFRLLGRSEINANPKDSRDHPEGVWTLPPVFRLGDKDRARYAAIGESDRMTLKFIKPAEPAPGKPPRSRPCCETL